MVGVGSQMLAGGVTLVLAGALLGEPAHLDLAHASTRSLLGFAYLVTFGSLIGFTAYFYLLGHTTAAKASTYAYVNPVVAIALGAIVLHESLTWTIGIGALLVLACVALVVRQESGTTTEAKPVPVAETG
jgi:drug/metabolite transporter (DMT)-like permease